MNLPVLIVGNEPQLRSLIRAILSKQGFPILEAPDGLTALTSIQDLGGALTVIVSTFSMSEINGDAFARQVKAQFPDTSILLMVSGATEGEGLPGDAFLAKPFLPSILVDTVWRLQRKQLQEGNGTCG